MCKGDGERIKLISWAQPLISQLLTNTCYNCYTYLLPFLPEDSSNAKNFRVANNKSQLPDIEKHYSNQRMHCEKTKTFLCQWILIGLLVDFALPPLVTLIFFSRFFLTKTEFFFRTFLVGPEGGSAFGPAANTRRRQLMISTPFITLALVINCNQKA